MECSGKGTDWVPFPDNSRGQGNLAPAPHLLVFTELAEVHSKGWAVPEDRKTRSAQDTEPPPAAVLPGGRRARPQNMDSCWSLAGAWLWARGQGSRAHHQPGVTLSVLVFPWVLEKPEDFHCLREGPVRQGEKGWAWGHGLQNR